MSAPPEETGTMDDTLDDTDKEFVASLRVSGDLPVLGLSDEAIINNLTTALGPGKRTGEKERNWHADKIYSTILCVATLTGNKPENVACCWDGIIDSDTLSERYNYKLPQIPLKGFSIQATLADYAQEAYEKHVQRQASLVMSKDVNYLQPTEFDKLRTLLGVGIRYSVNYWMLHPKLTRLQAYTQGKAYMYEHIKPKHTPKHIIDALVSARQYSDAKNLLLAQKVEPLTDEEKKHVDDDDKNKKVFVEMLDDDGCSVPHDAVHNFLKVVGFKWKMIDHPYGVEGALFAWIDKECPPAELNDFSKFSSLELTIRPDANFLQAKKDALESEKKQAQRAANKAKKEAKEKKAKAERVAKLLTQQKSLVHDLTLSFPSAAPKPAPAAAAPRRRSGTTSVPTAEQLKEKRKRKMQQFMDSKLPGMPRTKINITTAPSDCALAANGPRKVYKAFEKVPESNDFSCEIEYVPPGHIFGASLRKKFNNLRSVLGLVDILNPVYISGIYSDIQDELDNDDSWVTSKSVDFLAAAFAEAAGTIVVTTNSDGSLSVPAIQIDATSNPAKRKEFLADVKEIQDQFLSKADQKNFGLQIGAFAALHRDTKSISSEKVLEKALNDSEIPKNCANQIREWMAIVDMIKKKSKSNVTYIPFQPEFDCVIPGFEKLGQRTSERKKARTSILPTRKNGSGNLGSIV